MNMRISQRGFSSVMVIASIVMVASLCAFSLRFTASAQGSASVELLTERAQQAARAGYEWQRMQASLAVPACTPATNLVVPFTSGNFPVRVTCTQTAPSASTTDQAPVTSTSYNIAAYTITATSCWPAPAGCPNGAPPANYVQRTVVGTIEVPTP